MLDGIIKKNEIIGTAMQALIVRNDVINNNIANADTPNYKKKEVTFEAKLQEAVDIYIKTGKLDLNRVNPSIQEIHSNFKYRIDGNNVDMETEMIDLYTNSVRYDVMASCVGYKSIEAVLNGMK